MIETRETKGVKMCNARQCNIMYIIFVPYIFRYVKCPSYLETQVGKNRKEKKREGNERTAEL